MLLKEKKRMVFQLFLHEADLLQHMCLNNHTMSLEVLYKLRFLLVIFFFF